MAEFWTTAERPCCPDKPWGSKGPSGAPATGAIPVPTFAEDRYMLSRFSIGFAQKFATMARVTNFCDPILGACLSAVLLVSLSAAAQTGTSAAKPAPAAGQTQTFKSWALDCLVPKTGPGAGKRAC